MRRTFIQLAIVTTALAVVGFASPRSSPSSAPEAAAPSEPTPVAAQAAGLCGITQNDLADIVEHYDLVPSGPVFQAALQAPFDCSAYGELCSDIGAENAHTYVCGVWTALENHQALAQIRATAVDWLSTWALECPTDEGVCEEFCDPFPVKQCAGVWLGGGCTHLVVCNFYAVVEIPFFESILVPM